MGRGDDRRARAGRRGRQIAGYKVELKDAYKSLIESLQHGGIANNVAVNIEWMDSQIFEREDAAAYLEKVNGILVPGGFDERGAESRTVYANFARTQCAVFRHLLRHANGRQVEAARNMAVFVMRSPASSAPAPSWPG